MAERGNRPSRAFPGLVRIRGTDTFEEPLTGEIYGRRAAEKFRGTPLPPEQRGLKRTTFEHRNQTREGFRRGSFERPVTLRQFIASERKIQQTESRYGRHDTLAGWTYIADDGRAHTFLWPTDVRSLFDAARRFAREHKGLEGHQAMLEFAREMQRVYHATPASAHIVSIGEIQFQILGSEQRAA